MARALGAGARAAGATRDLRSRDILTDAALRNAMMVHAAFGGSTNLLLHMPAIAHSAGLRRPTVEDWKRVNRQVPRLVDALPNGPTDHPTVQVFLAGGVPEVMLHLARSWACSTTSALTRQRRNAGRACWTGGSKSERRAALARDAARTRRRRSRRRDHGAGRGAGARPDIARLLSRRQSGAGRLGHQEHAIDPSVVDADGVYRKRGPARVFTTEQRRRSRRSRDRPTIDQPGDVLVLICRGPMGAGMEEMYQITSALKHLPFGKHVAVITDARFSGVSTGACIGHVVPEALAGGPIGKLRDGDLIRIVDRSRTSSRARSISWAKHGTQFDAGRRRAGAGASAGATDLAADPGLPDDTRLWAALAARQRRHWGGCVYDAEAIIAKMSVG